MDKFLQQVRNDHRQFDSGKLEDHVGNDPMPLFEQWLKEAVEKPVKEPNAMAVSTIGEDGFPQSRIVYMRELLDGGFVFYTNYLSAKGRAMAVNPKVHALFFWPELERQVSIYGLVEKVPEAMSDAYYASRPRGSQIGAWASQQSEKLESRAELEQRIEQLLDHYPTIVPRPPHWGGYVIKPVKIEFWQGRPSRLHDRIVFEQEQGSWTVYRRNP